MIFIEEIRKNLAGSIENNTKEHGAKKVLADKLGIDKSNITSYISGSILPALDTFANLCVELGESSDEILGINSEIERRLEEKNKT